MTEEGRISPASLSDADLAAVWRKVGLDVSAELVEETVRRGEKMIPHLGPILVDEDLWYAEDDMGWAPPHALMLLQAIGGPKVTPYAVDFLRNGLGDDWLTGEGANLVFSLGPEALEDTWAIVTDADADECGRATAIDGLTRLALSHERLRPDVVARLRTLTDSILENPEEAVTMDNSVILEASLDALASLHDEAARDRIQQAYADDRFDLSRPEKADLLDLLDTPFEKILKGLSSNPLDHFRPENLREMKDGRLPPGDHDEEESEAQPFVRETKKVGRNDPCPCGSGKKYKKCCLPQ